MLTWWLAFFLPLHAVHASPAQADRNSRNGPFILGADISWVPEEEAEGAQYYDHGVRKDIFTILKEYKFNYVRLRLFVNPGASDGYAAGLSQNFCDLAHVEAMAKRAKAAGMGILLDIHYSDTWTSPGHQKKPLAWQHLSFPELTKAVHDFTYHAIKSLKDQGTPVNMVQIGNEISNGMLYPDGSRSHWGKFAALLKAGIAGTKEADPNVKIVLHHHLGRSNAVMRNWLDNLIQRGVKFDIIGMSCYAQAHTNDWKNNFDDLARRYPNKGLLVLEYSAHKRYLNNLMFHTPDKKGLGTFIWEPIRYRQAVFDKDGKNAGGRQASHFVHKKKPQKKAQAKAKPPTRHRSAAERAAWRKRSFGGRYDVNALMNLYPQMSKEFGNDHHASPSK